MKAGTSASISTYVFLHRIRERLKGRLTLTAVSDEETFGPWGARYLVEYHPEVLGDCLLNGEPGSPYTIRFGEKGAVVARVQDPDPRRPRRLYPCQRERDQVGPAPDRRSRGGHPDRAQDFRQHRPLPRGGARIRRQGDGRRCCRYRVESDAQHWDHRGRPEG